MKIITQNNPWRHRFREGDDFGGDILRGGQYIKCEAKNELLDERKLIYLQAICVNTWRALGRCGLDIINISKDFQYDCPYSENRYYHFMPYLILAKDSEIYRGSGPGNFDYALDDDWIRTWHLKKKNPEDKYELTIGPIFQSLRGHGYTSCCLEGDGSGDWKWVCIEIDNGDLIAGSLWVWFNK